MKVGTKSDYSDIAVLQGTLQCSIQKASGPKLRPTELSTVFGIQSVC